GKGALVGGTLGAGLGAGLTGMFMGANWLWKGGGGETASATAVKKQMERLNVMDEAEKLVLKGEEVDEAVRVAAADIKTKGSTPHKFITDPDNDLPLAALNRVRESSGELGSLR
ncbi:MAG: hypothetical protein GTO54_07405, partial [Nitrososphaeria archaeon]|nr:hypothetical protein [Nitrososphaeria archaeon]